MIIFQHDHAREIMTMGINPSNQHAIFFNQSKSYQLGLKMEQNFRYLLWIHTRSCLSCSCYDAVKPITSCQIFNPFRPEIPQWEIGHGIKKNRWFNDLVAIPLHRARRFSATRSPKSKNRALPLTVAICFTGSNVSPSFTCHSTLTIDCRLCKIFKKVARAKKKKQVNALAI